MLINYEINELSWWKISKFFPRSVQAEKSFAMIANKKKKQCEWENIRLIQCTNFSFVIRFWSVSSNHPTTANTRIHFLFHIATDEGIYRMSYALWHANLIDQPVYNPDSISVYGVCLLNRAIMWIAAAIAIFFFY